MTKKTIRDRIAPKPVRLWKIRYDQTSEISVVGEDLDSAKAKGEKILHELGLVDDVKGLDLLVVCFAGELYL